MATIQVELISTTWVDIPDEELKEIKEAHPDWTSWEIISEWKSNADNWSNYITEAFDNAELQEDILLYAEWDDGTVWEEFA